MAEFWVGGPAPRKRGAGPTRIEAEDVPPMRPTVHRSRAVRPWKVMTTLKGAGGDVG